MTSTEEYAHYLRGNGEMSCEEAIRAILHGPISPDGGDRLTVAYELTLMVEEMLIRREYPEHVLQVFFKHLTSAPCDAERYDTRFGRSALLLWDAYKHAPEELHQFVPGGR